MLRGAHNPLKQKSNEEKTNPGRILIALLSVRGSRTDEYMTAKFEIQTNSQIISPIDGVYFRAEC